MLFTPKDIRIQDIVDEVNKLEQINNIHIIIYSKTLFQIAVLPNIDIPM